MSVKLSDRLQTIEESATLALNTRAKTMVADGKRVYNFTAGEPSIDTPQYIEEFVSGKLGKNHYTPVAGIGELRKAIAAHCREFYSAEWIKEENIMVAAGGKPGLFLSLLSIVNPGDEVILPSPAWVSYKYLIELAGGTVVEAGLKDNFDLDVTNIQNKITAKTKVIIINSPHNPTGSVYSSAALRQLSKALTGNDITILSDDMYAKLVYTNNFEPVTNFGFKNLIISSGFSKSQALTGWRIGYVIADSEIIKAMTKLQSHMLGNTSTLSQYGALAGLAHDDKPPMLEDLRKNLAIVKDVLSDIPKLGFNPPGGAFYVFIDLRKITKNTLEWCEKLLEQKNVALVPGEAFSAPGYARLSFTTNESVLQEGLKKIKEFVEEGASQ